jgi:hypothetical protein
MSFSLCRVEMRERTDILGVELSTDLLSYRGRNQYRIEINIKLDFF